MLAQNNSNEAIQELNWKTYGVSFPHCFHPHTCCSCVLYLCEVPGHQEMTVSPGSPDHPHLWWATGRICRPQCTVVLMATDDGLQWKDTKQNQPREKTKGIVWGKPTKVKSARCKRCFIPPARSYDNMCELLQTREAYRDPGPTVFTGRWSHGLPV